MALERSQLSPSELSPTVAKALASGATRKMAARGLAPLPRPADMVTALYQLSLDGEAEVAKAAATTARNLPDAVLAGALEDASVDARVLDFFASFLGQRAELLERVIVNRSTAGATIAELAGSASTADVDLIAQNETRLLAHPAIIAAMFHNPHARMSTVDRAIELAARNQIEVPGIPGWEAVAKAALTAKRGGSASATGGEIVEADDDLFASFVAAESETSSPAAEEEGGRTLNLAKMTIPQKIRAATLGNKFVRTQLIRDSNKLVAAAAIKAPGVTDIEASKYASNHSLAEDVIRYISTRRDWTKNYGTKRALILNPKTPIADAMRFIPHLRERDLRMVARSKGIASAVSTHAKKLLTNRGSKKK